MQPKVSVIVPVYNAAAYLGRCLDSLLAQTLTDLEIIAVNDGSTDMSSKILHHYFGRDNRIKVVHKENSGVSDSRNRGIGLAMGEFISFVDADDWVDAEMFESMYHAAVFEKADIVMCTYIREFSGHTKEKVFDLPNKVYYRGNEVKNKLMRRIVGPLGEEMAKPEHLDAYGTVWSKLYRAGIIRDNRLNFIDLKEIGSNEDSLFNVQAFYYADSAVFLNKPFYHYWHGNTGSLTSSYRAGLKEQWFNLYTQIEAFLRQKGLPEDFYTALNNRICMNTLGFGFNMAGQANTASAMEKISLLEELLKDERIIQAYRQFDVTYFPHAWKLFYLLAKNRMPIPLYLMIKTINILRQVS